jgi:hypothetical protein
MITLFSVLGAITTAAVFFYVLTSWDTHTLEKETKIREEKDRELSKKTLDPKKVFNRSWDTPKPRICPMCGSFLNQDEYLFASISPPVAGGKKQAHIYGCRYCFVGVSRVSEQTESIAEIKEF